MLTDKDSEGWFNRFPTTRRPNMQNFETRNLYESYGPLVDHREVNHAGCWEDDEPFDWQDQEGNYCHMCEGYEEEWIRMEWVYATACLLLERRGRIYASDVCAKIEENRYGLSLDEWMENLDSDSE